MGLLSPLVTATTSSFFIDNIHRPFDAALAKAYADIGITGLADTQPSATLGRFSLQATAALARILRTTASAKQKTAIDLAIAATSRALAAGDAQAQLRAILQDLASAGVGPQMGTTDPTVGAALMMATLQVYWREH